MILNPEAFEFVTDFGVRMPFDGVLLGGADQFEHRMSEHLLLNKAGAVHQAQGQGPRRMTFRCMLSGPSAKDDYVSIESASASQPFGMLVHPFFGSMAAVFRSASLTYDFDQATNSLEFEARFDETTIRKPAPKTPSGSAAAAQHVVKTLAASPAVTGSAALTAKVQKISFAVDAMMAQILTDTNLTAQPLRVALANVSQAVDAMLADAGSDGWLRYNARMVFCQALQAYNAAAAQRPPVVVRTVDGAISLPRFCVQLYGGGAAEMETEILALNRVRPLSIPTGTRLLVPDPEWIRRSLS